MLRKLYEKLGIDGDSTRLGEILIMRDKCTRKQVLQALSSQKKEGAGRRLGSFLMSISRISQDDINEALDIQTYLRQEMCSEESMKNFEKAAKNFLIQRESLENIIDKTNGILSEV